MHYLKGVRQPIPTGHVTITDAASLAAAIPRTGLCNGSCGIGPGCPQKANSPGYTLANLRDGGRRLKADTIGSEWLMLDVDEPEVPEALLNYERVEVQTHSGRWHVLVRLEREATPAEYDATIKPWVGQGADNNAKDVCRFLYAPAQGASVTAYEGERLPVVTPKAVAKAAPAPVKAVALPWTDEAMRKVMLDDPADTNTKAGHLGAALAFRSMSQADALAYATRMLGGGRHVGSAMTAWQQVSGGVRPHWDGARQLSKDYGLALTVPDGGKLERLRMMFEIKYELAWNEMALHVELEGRPWQDTDTTDARLACERAGIKQIAKGDVEDLAIKVAQQNAYHPVKRYIGGLAWDGKARLDTLWVRYFGAEDTPLNRALGACFGIGAVRRVLEPGSKVDMMPILYGPQGALKSTALRALAGDAFFTDARPNFGHRAENAMTLNKCWIWELAELEGMDRSEQREIKAFVTRAEDDVLLPYARAKTTLRRHAVMLGTTNEENCLRDATGSRRHPVIEIGTIDVRALRRDRDLLWAEAKARALAGEQHWLSDAQETERAKANEEHIDVHGGFEARALDWLANPPKGRISFGMSDFLSEGCHVPISGQTKAVQAQAGLALRLAGFAARRGGKPRKLTIYSYPESSSISPKGQGDKGTR